MSGTTESAYVSPLLAALLLPEELSVCERLVRRPPFLPPSARDRVRLELVISPQTVISLAMATSSAMLMSPLTTRGCLTGAYVAGGGSSVQRAKW